MATIYLKETGNSMGLNTLILEPRELLVYPFDFGANWKSVHAAIAFSFCGAVNGDNSLPVNENINNEIPYNQFFFGFSDKPELPRTSDSVYVGYESRPNGFSTTTVLENDPGSNNFSNFPGATNGITYTSTSIISGVNRYYSFGINSYKTLPQFAHMTGISPSGATFMNIRATFDNTNKTVAFGYTANIKTQQPNCTTPHVLNNMNQLGGDGSPQPFNSGNGQGPMFNKPSYLLIYCPLQLNKMRIHNLIVRRDL